MILPEPGRLVGAYSFVQYTKTSIMRSRMRSVCYETTLYHVNYLYSQDHNLFRLHVSGLSSLRRDLLQTATS